MIFEPIAKLFERWINPYDHSGDLTPPKPLWRFVWYYVRQAKSAFVVMLLLGGIVAVLEAALSGLSAGWWTCSTQFRRGRAGRG